MPTYDYLCDACQHAFELLQSIKAEPVKKCPKCGKLKLRRLFSTGGGILFKGSGFYQTDYRSKSYQEGAKKETPSAPPASESSPKETPKKESSESPAKKKSKKD